MLRPGVLLFGSLALSFDETAWTQLRNVVAEDDEYQWIVETIAQLPQDYKTIVDALPDIQAGSASAQLQNVKDAFQLGRPLDSPFPLPNMLLIPLVVIHHLTQYHAIHLRTSAEVDNSLDVFASLKSRMETLGFCTGLLSAFAVSSSSTRQEFVRYGAAAIRLGMLIGMAVDAQDGISELGPSKSLGVAWNSVEKGEQLRSIVSASAGVRPFHPINHPFL